MRNWQLIIIISMLFASHFHPVFADLKTLFTETPKFGPGIPLFPDPYEDVLETIVLPEEQVVYLFRERMKAQYLVNQGVETYQNQLIVRALDRSWRAKSAEVCRYLALKPEKSIARFSAMFAHLPTKADQGAFSFLLSNLPNELTEIAKFAPQARESCLALQKPYALSVYIKQVEKTEFFFKKRPVWLTHINHAADKVEGLLDRLQEAFSLEILIMAVNWLGNQQLLPENANYRQISHKLTQRLIAHVRDGLQAELTIGIEPDEIVAIEKSVNPAGIMVKQTLYRGRIRRFVKLYQKVFTRNQLSWLEPSRQGILAEIRELKRSEKNPKSLSTLQAMEKNLDEIRTFMEVKTGIGKVIEDTLIAVFHEAGEVIKKIDPDNLLSR